MNRQADRLEDDGQSEDTSSGDARGTHTGCCGGDPGGGEERSGRGRSVMGEAVGVGLLLPARVRSQGRSQVPWGS